jgi:hypothetical protein
MRLSKLKKLDPSAIDKCAMVFVPPNEKRRNLFFGSRNKPKQMRNRSFFGLFRFEPKFIFVCFEDTLLRTLYLRTLGKGGEGQVKGGDRSVLSPVCAGRVGQKCSTHTDGPWVIRGPGFSHLALSVLFY